MQEAISETIENTAEHDSETVGKGVKSAQDEIRRAIS
jgi:hypothetical protein